jgi:hypothetical protein
MLTGEFGRRGWALIGLRYRLIWAQARSSQGMISALLALYLLGALGALLFAFGGVGAAIAAIELGQGESICRWMLTTSLRERLWTEPALWFWRAGGLHRWGAAAVSA